MTNIDLNDMDMILIEQRKREENEENDVMYKRRLKPEMVGKYQTVRVFLGDVIGPKVKEEAATDSDEDETIGFRLQGEEPPKQKNEPVAEMLLSKKEMGEDVRKCLRQLRRKQPEKRKKGTEGRMKLNNDQKLFLRTHGTMGLACLRAVHQAYGDRARTRKQAELNERVSEMKERRELGIERLQVGQTVLKTLKFLFFFQSFLNAFLSFSHFLTLFFHSLNTILSFSHFITTSFLSFSHFITFYFHSERETRVSRKYLARTYTRWRENR